MLNFSDGNRALPSGSLKHTCPFSPTYLIAVGTLINLRAVCHLAAPTLSTDKLGQTAHLTWRFLGGTGICDLYKLRPQLTEDELSRI